MYALKDSFNSLLISFISIFFNFFFYLFYFFFRLRTPHSAQCLLQKGAEQFEFQRKIEKFKKVESQFEFG